jgi:hypothetical protein
MKRITAIALLAIANFALAGTSFAQSNGVEAKVPFAFTVGNTSLPAGTYTIKFDSAQLLMITNNAQHRSTALSLYDRDGRKSSNGGQLLFHKYGSQYFLSEILCDYADMNLKIPDSTKEKKVRLQQAGLVTSSETLVAAR